MHAECTSGGDGVTYNEHVNVAIAVTMEGGGLITPVLVDADKKDIYSMSRYASHLANENWDMQGQGLG